LTEVGPYYDAFNESVIANPRKAARFPKSCAILAAQAPDAGLATRRAEGDHAAMTPR